MEKLGVDALRKRVSELERENAQLRSHIGELHVRVAKLEHEAQTMRDLIWENARASSPPPPLQPAALSGSRGSDGDGSGV